MNHLTRHLARFGFFHKRHEVNKEQGTNDGRGFKPQKSNPFDRLVNFFKSLVETEKKDQKVATQIKKAKVTKKSDLPASVTLSKRTAPTKSSQALQEANVKSNVF